MLKVGDVVQLKSGGPIMTISAVDDPGAQMADDLGLERFSVRIDGRPPVIWCVWFEGTKKMSGDFAPETLEKVG